MNVRCAGIEGIADHLVDELHQDRIAFPDLLLFGGGWRVRLRLVFGKHARCQLVRIAARIGPGLPRRCAVRAAPCCLRDARAVGRQRLGAKAVRRDPGLAVAIADAAAQIVARGHHRHRPQRGQEADLILNFMLQRLLQRDDDVGLGAVQGQHQVANRKRGAEQAHRVQIHRVLIQRDKRNAEFFCQHAFHLRFVDHAHVDQNLPERHIALIFLPRQRRCDLLVIGQTQLHDGFTQTHYRHRLLML